MKRFIGMLALVTLIVYSLSPVTSIKAASSKAKIEQAVYKGQPYVRASGINQTAANKINQALKQYAVNAAASSVKLKKANKESWHKISVKTVYNSNAKLSVLFEYSIYYGGAHDVQGTDTFNFDLTTGNRIYLKDVINNQTKLVNTRTFITYMLSEKFKKNPSSIFEESITNYPFDPVETGFYFGNTGIAVRFDPYQVGPFSEGIIDIPVPYTVIDYKAPTISINANQDVIKSKIDDDFEGFDEGNIYELANGQIWKQENYHYHYAYSYRPDVIIYKDGGSYYMKVEGQDQAVRVSRLK
ncbi:MAG: PdaC/SigV domain-containing protein [Bacillota bacterium]